ncbi:MAG: T9SS type A sorting domain-containing protein [Chitinophagaceae bacterium]|nr:T9SS type A sorting domain-containing protein [Chitinophagaceae bacterium]
MKRKTLLLLVMTSFIISTHAQKKEKQPTTGYAITALEKGGRSWKEVKLVDVTTGEEVRSIYQSATEIEALNARTKKPVLKKDGNASTTTITTTTPTVEVRQKKVVNLDDALNQAQGTTRQVVSRVIVMKSKPQVDKPFSTNSAAMAYDKKHERLYYTPMGINQLRYIDLKSNKIYYFEDETFGQVKSSGDAPNQITRMVIASDGDGYALSNDAKHLIKFTTGKKPVITDLGALIDDTKNGNFSVHHGGGFGGDMIADANENLYLITANRNVYKISIETRVATHQGVIKGLPRGFSTNGAMVEEGSKVIVASSESTAGYFRFDLVTLQAERVSKEGAVYNASDLANGNLAFEKKKKEKKQENPVVTEEAKKPVVDETARNQRPEVAYDNNISVYPNPVTAGTVKVSFTDLPVGRYQVQLLDLSGRLVSSQEVNVNAKLQVNDFNLPDVAKGSYLLKVSSELNKVSVTNKLVVQ